MRQLPDDNTEVLIVGAGPTGLMMACQLAIHEIPFRIIDKNESISRNSGALIVQARSLEIFEQMGIAGEALRKGIIANKVNIINNGKNIAGTKIKDIGGTLSPFPFLLMLEQSETEKLLEKFISDRGHRVERGIRLKDFTLSEEVAISIVVFPDESEQTIISRYLIAADGSKSLIRNLLNIPFEGRAYPKPIFILDCRAKSELLHNEIYFAFSKTAVAGFFPLQGSRWRIDGIVPRESEKYENITFNLIKNDFKHWIKLNVNFQENEWFSVSHSHQKYAATIRVQNCFLAGDAAHVNTPVGAQGMNTGLQDAYNLAWKLAFVIKKKATQELLDTYTTERSGISKGFARYADSIFRIITSNRPTVKFILLIGLNVFFKVIFPLIEKRNAFRKMFFKSISQINIHYKKSSLSYYGSEGFFPRSAPEPGDRLPYMDFKLNGKPVDIYKLIDTSCFNLIVMTDSVPEELKEIATNYNLAIIQITKLPETSLVYELMGIKTAGYFLIRPDMHIAMRSATMNAHHLLHYLKTVLILNK